MGADPGAWDRALARRIDHTLLRPDAVASEIDRLCEEALRYQFAAACVQPCWASAAAARLRGGDVGLAVVVGFPHGASTTAAKAFEAARAVADGATEIDMVVNLGWLKGGEHARARDEVAAVVRAAGAAAVKVILETALLRDDEKVAGAVLAREAGARFVKTCTGFGPGGATTEDVRGLRQAVGGAMGVKASGGIRTYAAARAMLAAGADRLGCSASVAIVSEAMRDHDPAGDSTNG